jgi:hypothetical protein
VKKNTHTIGVAYVRRIVGGAGSSKRDWSCGSSKLIAYSFGMEVEAATPERVENVSVLRNGRLYPIRPN